MMMMAPTGLDHVDRHHRSNHPAALAAASDDDDTTTTTLSNTTPDQQHNYHRSRRRSSFVLPPRRPNSNNMRLLAQPPRRRRYTRRGETNQFSVLLCAAWDLGRKGCASVRATTTMPMMRRGDLNQWWRGRNKSNVLLTTTALILISFGGMRTLRNNSWQFWTGQQHPQRAESVGRILYLNDRHSSADWQATPVLALDDAVVVEPYDDDDNEVENENSTQGKLIFGGALAVGYIEDPISAEEEVGPQPKAPGVPLKPKEEEEEQGGRAGDEPDEEPASLELVLQHLANLTLTHPYGKHQQLNRIFQIFRGASVSNGRTDGPVSTPTTADSPHAQVLVPVLQTWLHHWNQDVMDNVAGGIKWVRPFLLTSPRSTDSGNETVMSYSAWVRQQYPEYFAVVRHPNQHRMKWQDEWDALSAAEQNQGPVVDYTDTNKYVYPPTIGISKGPVQPRFTRLGEILARWKQNEDHVGTVVETIIHLDYTNSVHRETAMQYRRANLPFKLVNVPDVSEARLRWNDEYLSTQFDQGRKGRLRHHPMSPPPIDAAAHESINNFFLTYDPDIWDIFRLGLAPTRTVGEFSYADWSRHARYADAVRLGADRPHFVWQVRPSTNPTVDGVVNGTFVTRELYSIAAPKNEVFAGDPNTAHCHLAERGTVSAMHADAVDSFVAVITGAVRIILSPPAAHAALGIDASSESPLYRHSPLDLSHLSFVTSPDPASQDMSEEEREALTVAATVDAVETIVKAGEVLYIPRYEAHRHVFALRSPRTMRKHVNSRHCTAIGHATPCRFRNRPDVQ